MSRITLFFLIAPFLLGLAVASQFGLGVDEAHYMMYARNLDWSYFDHPPLVGWVHFIFGKVFGTSELAARLPALLLGLFTSFRLFAFLERGGHSEVSARWVTLAVAFCLQFFVLNLFLLPDSLILALFWPLAETVERLSRKFSAREWLALGLYLGLMGLSKYTAIFFLVPIAVVLFSTRGPSIFQRDGALILGAVLLAGILILPVLLWNQKHGWLSFRYQLGHVAGGSEGLAGFFKSWASQIVLYSPFLWPLAGWGFYLLGKSRKASMQFLFLTALVHLGFFSVSSLREAVLPHWPAIFYLCTLPVGLADLFQRRRNVAQSLVVLSSSLSVLVAVAVASPLKYRFPEASKEIVGWPEVMRLGTQRLQSDQDLLVFLNWTYGSRALFYGVGFEDQIFVLDDRFDQFDLWNPRQVEGRNLVVIEFSYDKPRDLGKILRCSGPLEKENVPVLEQGRHVYDLNFTRCPKASSLLHTVDLNVKPTVLNNLEGI